MFCASSHARFEVPEWASKYIQYSRLAAILDTLPRRNKEVRKIDAEIALELENAATLHNRDGSPPPPTDSASAAKVPVPSRRRLSVTRASASTGAKDVLGRVTIELRSDLSTQKEYALVFLLLLHFTCTRNFMRRYSNESYEYIVFVADVESLDVAVNREIAQLTAACRVHSYALLPLHLSLALHLCFTP